MKRPAAPPSLCLLFPVLAALLFYFFSYGFLRRTAQDEHTGHPAPGALAASEPGDAVKNYLTIKKLHWYWKNGPSYARRIYKRDLQLFLTELIGNTIETDMSYIIQSPGDLADKKVECNLIDCRWLYFYGPVDVENLRGMVKNDPALLKKWWRSGHLFSLSGKVKKYRFGRDIYGETVEINLDKIALKGPDKK